METNKENVENAQGAETTKQGKVSASYTIRSFGENIKKLRHLGLIGQEEETQLKKIHKKTAETFMLKELGL